MYQPIDVKIRKFICNMNICAMCLNVQLCVYRYMYDYRMSTSDKLAEILVDVHKVCSYDIYYIYVCICIYL